MSQFMQDALYKKSGIFHSGITPGKQDCPAHGDVDTTAVSDAAFTMQALSSLALNANGDGLKNILISMTQHTTGNTWNSDDGVLDPQRFPTETENNVHTSQQLLRSYFNLAFDEGDLYPKLKTYIRTYLAVQYNALVGQSTFASDAPNLYGTGSKHKRQLDPDAQLLAITTLLGGVISSENPTTPDIDSRGRRPQIGVIVGGIVGGVLGLFLVAAVCYYYLRRRRQLRSLPIVDPYPVVISEKTVSWRNFVKPQKAPGPPSIAVATISATIPPAVEPRPSRMRKADKRPDLDDSPPEYRSQAGTVI
ncbi:hypothetical protein PM082_015730 [Marasmius tenuissimus]|nr:hypothetical protein PM082_015730 [Marasmius tenuissimus]